jgi:hypothetical protein
METMWPIAASGAAMSNLFIRHDSLQPSQRLTVEIIEALGFGVIQGLSISDGQPCFDSPPKIVQSVKLGSPPERLRGCRDTDTPKKEFVQLFARLSELPDGTVDIEVQHGLPFRLIVERSWGELA